MFETNRQFDSLSFAARSFRELKALKRFRFRAGKEEAEINRYTASRYYYSYRLAFYAIERQDKVDTQTFEQSGLKWTDMVTLFEDRRAVKTKIKLIILD